MSYSIRCIHGCHHLRVSYLCMQNLIGIWTSLSQFFSIITTWWPCSPSHSFSFGRSIAMQPTNCTALSTNFLFSLPCNSCCIAIHFNLCVVWILCSLPDWEWARGSGDVRVGKTPQRELYMWPNGVGLIHSSRLWLQLLTRSMRFTLNFYCINSKNKNEDKNKTKITIFREILFIFCLRPFFCFTLVFKENVI